MRQFYLFALCFLFLFTAHSQNVSNMFYSGDLNSFGADAMSFSNGKWQVVVEATADDANSLFLFRDNGGNFVNKWSGGIAINYGSIETAFWQGGDTDINVTNTKYYTFNLSNVTYGNDGELIVQETDNTPINFALSNAITPSSPTVYPGQDLELTVTLAGNKSSQEKVFIRYTSDSFVTSDVVEVSFASATASSGTATIPGSFNTAGANVIFYAYSTTVAATSSSNHDLITLNLENNTGSNYTYTVQSSWTTANGATTWTTPSSWDAGEVPPPGVSVTIEDNLTLDTDAIVSNITINATFTSEAGQSRTLSIEDGGSFSKNGSGSFAANDGSVVFEGSGAITGTIIFNSIEIAGGVAFPSPANTNDFISNSLTINEGGYLAQTPGGAGITTENDIPGYTNGASLIFTGTFDVNSFASGWGTTVSSTPTNVQVLNGGALTLSLDRNTTNFTVDASSSLTINPARGLTVTGDLTNNGTVTLNSTSTLYSSLIVNGTATGDITYNRYTAEVGPTGTNDLIASPVSGQDFGPFATANSGALAASETLRAFAPFDPVNNIYTNYDTVTNANTPITPGIGYRAATNSGQTLAFTGTPNNGAVAVTLQDNTSFWNLIGNPYPSYIDIGDFLAENVDTTNINASFYGVYGYDGDVTNGWTVWDLNVDQDLLIAPGQGFFVAAPSGGGSGIDFTTAMRPIGTSDDFIAERNITSDANFAHAILNLNTASTTYVTNVYFRDINTRGLDPGYDTGAFDQNAIGVFTQLAENNNGVNLVNQSLPYNDLNEVTVPLNVNMSQVQTLDFSLDNNTILPPAINVYLEDTVTSTFTLLYNNTYQVTPEIALNGTGRFFLRFTSGTLGIDQETINSLNIYHDAEAKNIVIGGQLNENTAAYVYDLQGRLVQSHVLQAALVQQHMDVSSLHTGIYIVKIGQQITHKIMIR